MPAANPVPTAAVRAMPPPCPTRMLADQLSDKWSICVLLALADGPVRFNALKRIVVGVTQKMLGQTLRRLAENGLVERRAYPTMPMRVDYDVTALGRTLLPIIVALQAWAEQNRVVLEAARARAGQSVDGAMRD